MYGGVIVVGAIGAVIARFKPAGMARALLTTALAQTLVALIALVGRMGSGPLEIVTINGFFVALFVGSAVLFWKAARGPTRSGRGLTILGLRCANRAPAVNPETSPAYEGDEGS